MPAFSTATKSIVTGKMVEALDQDRVHVPEVHSLEVEELEASNSNSIVPKVPVAGAPSNGSSLVMNVNSLCR